MILLLATGCGLLPGGGGSSGGGADPGGGLAGEPANPAVEMRPDLIAIDPVTVASGDVVGLAFPEETSRGVLFVLDQRVDDAWVSRFYLTSDGPGQGWQRQWWPVNAEGMAVPDIGVAGPGPDRVLIPDVAEPGDYRICTGNAGADICAPIEIVAP
jgi:hypothetical protein